MRRILAGLVTGTLILLSTLVANAPSADAALGDNYCISKGEFRALVRGMTAARVYGIVDYRGKQTYYDSGYPGPYGWPASQTRDYRQCLTKYGSASLDFEYRRGAWRLTGKHAFWW